MSSQTNNNKQSNVFNMKSVGLVTTAIVAVLMSLIGLDITGDHSLLFFVVNLVAVFISVLVFCKK